MSLQRERTLILALLLILAAASWAILLWQSRTASGMGMGLEHGIYCLGCNWLLFVLLFPLGMMNIAAMALLTALIFAEKCFPLGVRIAQFAALALILYGALVIVVPVALPLSGAGM